MALLAWLLAGCAARDERPESGTADSVEVRAVESATNPDAAGGETSGGSEESPEAAASDTAPAAGQTTRPTTQGPADVGAAAVDESDAQADAGPPEPLLDRTQKTVFNVVNSTSLWFDGFFGAASLNVDADEEAEVTRGLLAVGTGWDQRDEFDARVRFRAQFPLPAIKERTRLLLGRGDTDDLVDGSETETVNSLPEQFSDFTDDDWLLGLGYRQRGGLRNGFDYGIGVSIRSSQIDPYARITYRWNKAYGESMLWRLRPRLFWQDQRGEGASLTSIFDVVASPAWMLRAWTTLTAEERVQGVGWKHDFLAYQSIDDSTAMSYRLYANGETGHPVELQDYGIEVRYRRRVLREWLFLELSAGVGWPREFVEEVRESNLGVGIQLEMQFGDWPGREQERPATED